MKTNKPLWRISITTTPEAEDAVAEMLGAASGLPASCYFDLESRLSTVTIYREAKPDAGLRAAIAGALEQIGKCGLKIGPGKLTIARVRREDWAESWKRHFKPIEIGKALLIKPSWSKRKPRKHQEVLVLDPGLSFGTGQHPTTEFCLRKIVAAAPRRQFCDDGVAATKSFLDIGAGSGILAIAAAKLGFRPVHAFDFDANAVKIARVNARMNGAGGRIRLWHGDVARLFLRPVQKYNLVCANLISDLLIAERRRIAAQVESGGRLVLAGILKSEFAAVQREFEKLGLKLASSRADKEWRSAVFRQLQKV